MTLSNLDRFEHVVVLMLENRSFDNLLGYLYEPGQVPHGQAFEGVAGRDLSNPIPPYADGAERETVPVERGYVMDNPNPDPGEEYPHINTQIYGIVIPEQNRYREALLAVAPFNVPDPLPDPALMNGFITDYIDMFQVLTGRAPTYDEYRIIMQCFSPETLPVISTLAREFAVCDHWFCAVPSQTFTNRAFFNASSASGFVVNPPFINWIAQNNAETIFNRIESFRSQGLSWKVYFDKEDVFSLTALIHFPRLRDYFETRFDHMEQFYRDALNGNLPSYSFIEPRIFFNHNDAHPPIQFMGVTYPSSVLAAELLINDVYEAIRNSDNPNGSNYRNTLLVITFDEHGGCYDHVSPPRVAPPDPSAPPGQMGFRFDRLGVRVPTVLVSAYIEPGTVINTPLHHSSLIKTLSDKWGLGPLTERDRTATNIGEAFNRETPRDRAEWPVITPRDLVREGETNLFAPMNDLQKGFMALVAAVEGTDKALQVTDLKTVDDALLFMRNTMASRSFQG